MRKGLLVERQRERREARREEELLSAGKTKEEVEAELEKERKVAETELHRELTEFLVLERIGDKEKIFATEDEVRERITLMAAVYGLPPDTLREELKSSGRLEEIRMNLRTDKVKAFLRKKAKVSGEAGSSSSAVASEEVTSEEVTSEETAGGESDGKSGAKRKTTKKAEPKAESEEK